MQLEVMDGKVLEEIGRKKESEIPDPDDHDDDDGILFDEDDVKKDEVVTEIVIDDI